MTQTAIPFLFMRGGTSRGPFFNRADLPQDLDALAEVLIKAVGSGHPLNIDGIGGGAAVTTKVAMLSPSQDDWAEIDYFFAQVSVEDRLGAAPHHREGSLADDVVQLVVAHVPGPLIGPAQVGVVLDDPAVEFDQLGRRRHPDRLGCPHLQRLRGDRAERRSGFESGDQLDPF